MPGSGPLTTVEGSPWHPQRSARRRHADLRCERLDGHQQSFPCSRLNPSSPATFPWTSRIVWAVCSSFSSRATFASSSCTFRAEGVALGGLPTAFARGQALKRPLTPRPAPFRQMGAVQPLAAKQPAHLAGLRAALCLLQNPQSILRGELAPLRLGHDLRVPGVGRAWLAPSLAMSSISLSAVIGVHLHRPTVITRGAGVSVMLAEREGERPASQREPSAQGGEGYSKKGDGVLRGAKQVRFAFIEEHRRTVPG